jgi:hypothetical protein
MLNKALKILGALFLACIPVIVSLYLNRSAPDVRYTLSEKIPISFLSTGTSLSENVQQLEVKNIGNAEATRVVVKINGEITSYEVIKYSAADNVQEFKTPQSLEVVYPQLPPQAGFKIVFKSPGDGIEYRDVAISHDAGIAQEALAKSEPGLFGALSVWISYALIVFYFALIIYYLRKISAETWRERAESQAPLQTLSADKPWYISEKDWKTTRHAAVSRKIRGDYLAEVSIQKSAAYQLLSADKPDKTDGSDWEGAIALAVDSLNRAYTAAIKSAWRESNLIELLQVSRPKNFPSEKWGDLQKQANERFIEFRTRMLYSAESLRQALLDRKPDTVSEAAWDKYISDVQEQYYQSLLTDLERSEDPVQFLNQVDLKFMQEKHKRSLRQACDNLVSERTRIARYNTFNESVEQVAQRKYLGDTKPDTLKDWDWQQLKRLETSLEEFSHASELDAKTRELMRLLDILLRQGSLGGDKPAHLADQDWDKLKLLEESIGKLKDAEEMRRENVLESSRLMATNGEISLLKQKLEKQLSIIQQVLTDPSVMERIEAYNDTFARGNFKNLKRVADLLNERKVADAPMNNAVQQNIP